MEEEKNEVRLAKLSVVRVIMLIALLLLLSGGIVVCLLKIFPSEYLIAPDAIKEISFSDEPLGWIVVFAVSHMMIPRTFLMLYGIVSDIVECVSITLFTDSFFSFVVLAVKGIIPVLIVIFIMLSQNLIIRLVIRGCNGDKLETLFSCIDSFGKIACVIVYVLLWIFPANILFHIFWGAIIFFLGFIDGCSYDGIRRMTCKKCRAYGTLHEETTGKSATHSSYHLTPGRYVGTSANIEDADGNKVGSLSYDRYEPGEIKRVEHGTTKGYTKCKKCGNVEHWNRFY